MRTAEEFAAHLGALADILREANKRLPVHAGRKKRRFARIEADLVGRLEADAAARVTDSIGTLELALALRDAGQHGAASGAWLASFQGVAGAVPSQ